MSAAANPTASVIPDPFYTNSARMAYRRDYGPANEHCKKVWHHFHGDANANPKAINECVKAIEQWQVFVKWHDMN